MQKTFSLKRARLATLLGAVLLGTMGTSPLLSQAQPRLPNLRDRLGNNGIPRLQLKLAPELRTYLIAQKPVVNAQLLRSAFIFQDGVPAFKLSDGSVRLLMPSEDAPAPSAAAPLPPELSAAQGYIFAPLQLRAVRNGIFKFNPGYLLATGVDHRSTMTPIRDQGSRGTCTAFAFMGAVESFPNVQTDLSEQYLFHQGQGKAGQPYSTHKGLLPKLAAEVGTEGLVSETAWPYTNSFPPDNETVPDAATKAAKYKVTDWQFIPDSGLTGPSIKNPNYLETLLDKGYNIPFWTKVAWYGSHNNDVIDVVIDSVTKEPAASGGDHEMVIVGYDAPKKYFIVRNSWGTGFGHAGYAYISYDYIRTYSVEGLYIKKMSAPLTRFRPNLNDRFTPRIIPRLH